jgi:cytochrome c556
MGKVFVGLCIVLWLQAALAALGEGDSRQRVEFPEMMRQHMLANMRDHLMAITEIQHALSSGAFNQAAEIAENRIGMSSLKSHGAAHMAPFMPKQMQEIGTEMHRLASQFAAIAQESAVDGDVKRAVGALALVTKQCVTCHTAYRAH